MGPEALFVRFLPVYLLTFHELENFMAGLDGKTLNRYELRYIIGKGGMADVYLAYDLRFQRSVAIKVFKRDDEELLRRFVREARLMASLRHSHLMPIYDAGESTLDGVPQYYIVMPYMEGGALRTRTKKAPLALSDACRYLSEIADALDYIHQRGIIHRDIKSSNVLLNAEDHSYLSDFGIARATSDATQLTTTGGVLGTVDYVAPELFEEDRRADARSDLYSLGVLLYEMVTGRLPFAAESQIALVAMHISKPPPSPRSLISSVSPQTERVMLRALAKRPEQRFASATALAEAFCLSLSARSSVGLSSAIPEQQEANTISPYDEKTPFDPQPVIASTVRPAPLASSTRDHIPAYAIDSQVPLSQFPTSKTKRSPQRGRRRIVTIVALLALLVVIGPVAFVLTRSLVGNNPAPATTQTANKQTSTPTATPNLTATASAAVVTATAQAQQTTATAIAHQTATVQAQVSATAGVIQTATAGNPTYVDSLTDANNAATTQAHWDQNGHCAFQSDGYHVSATGGLFGTPGECREARNKYANAAISVDMAILSGKSGGIFFRSSVTPIFRSSAGYLFEVDNQGNYTISRSTDFSAASASLKAGTISAGFKSGTRNTLQLIASGNNLSFYVNGVFLTSLQDTTFTSGTIALLATLSDDGSNGDVVYSNLKVFPL